MGSHEDFPHLGGGRKGLFLLLRYVFIIAASYLLIFQADDGTIHASHAVLIAMALASNVALSFVPPQSLFAWYLEAPILVADTLWISWALHSTAAGGQEFFLLYFFVLFVATVSESLWVVVLGAVVINLANLYFAPDAVWTTPQLLRVVFFFAVALFYGNALTQLQHERRRAQHGFALAKELGKTVAERNEELRWLYQEAVVANRLKSELVANVSHELRTPLHQIIGYNELLGAGEFGRVTAAQREATAVVNNAARALLRMVNAMLDMRRLDAGPAPLEIRTIPIAELVRDLDEEIRPTLGNPNVRFEWVIADDLPPIDSDWAKLKLILRNLIQNALKFTQLGYVRVTVVEQSGGLELTVADTGVGIPLAVHGYIFEPFVQTDGSLSRTDAGVGLGLHIAKRLVDALGGSISVQSDLGAGSVFRVWVPTHSATPASRAPDAA